MQGRTLSVDETLLFIAKKNHEAYVLMFEQKNYGAAFRTAAFNLDKPVLELLLKDKVKVAIKLDVNGQSSNGRTALDWAFETKSGHVELLGEVVDLLMRSGAQTEKELLGLSESSEEEKACQSSDEQESDETFRLM